jgi:uncharacterized protein (TIGR03083 family)
VQTSELYPAIRAELLTLADRLSSQEAATPVPALPGWTVKDTYAHLTGVCADVLDGRMDGGGTPRWTAKQVRDRADRGLPAVCDEWRTRGPDFDEWLGNTGEQGTTFVGFDIWAHQQDIRSAVGLAGERDQDQLAYLTQSALAVFDRRFREATAPALHVTTDTVERDLGDGPPAATLHADDYEMLRILFGRRSQAQMRRARWEGDPAPYLDHIHLFELPTIDLCD